MSGCAKRRMRRRANRAAAILRDRRGAALIEFAMVLPVVFTLGSWGVELANMAAVKMQVSQVAMTLADNASRLGQTDNSSVTPTVSEGDIDSIMAGALREGRRIDLEGRGRVILSSLEKDGLTGKQFIHWQRCRGRLARTSRYGNDTTLNGLVGPVITGLGAGAQKITAGTGSAVMFVEITYAYQGVFGTLFASNVVFRQEAAFIVRDDRNLTPGVTGSGGQSAC